MIGIFLLITFSIYIVFLYFKLIHRINLLSSSFIFFIYLFASFTITVATKNIFLSNKIVLVTFGLLSFFTLFILIFKYRNKHLMFIKELFPYIFAVLLTVFVFAFSKQGIRDFISLMPLSESASQINIAQNIYFNSSLIVIDRTINGLVLFISNFLSLFGGLSSTEVVIVYVNLTSLLFYYYVSEMLIQIWLKNNNGNKILNSGVILYIGSLFSFTLFKFSYLSHLWLVFPISSVLFNLFNKTNVADLFLTFLAVISLFVLGINFKLTVLISLVLAIICIIFVLIDKCNKLLDCKSIIIICFVLLLIVSFLFNKNLSLSSYTVPNASNIFFSCLDISTNNFLICVFLMLVLIYTLANQKGVSSTQLCILIVILIIVNPLILNATSDIENFQVLMMLFFNPIIYSYIFSGIDIKVEKLYVINSCVVMMAVSNQLMVNPYFTNDSFKYDINARIEKDELEVNEFLSTLITNQEVKVISQAPFTKAFVPNITLLDDYKDMMNRCQYCDVFTENLHEPSNLINIFTYREYSGNQLFIELPDYKTALSLTIEGNYRYLILRNDQIIEYNSNWIPLSDLFIGKYEILLKNETYILMGLIN